MARIRSVSPALRMSETVASWPMPARYAWVLLWGYLDDYGRGMDNARLIAADCFPLDDEVSAGLMSQWLQTYEHDGSICRYEVEGKRYLHSLNWSDHQKPQHPSKVRIPPCPGHEPGAHKTWSEDRDKERQKVSGDPHEGLVSHSPTSSSRGEVSLEMSKGDEGGSFSRANDAPPLYPDHCPDHQEPVPPKCGGCQKQKAANKAAAEALPDYRLMVVPPECGECDNRWIETDTGLAKCPTCYPKARTA